MSIEQRAALPVDTLSFVLALCLPRAEPARQREQSQPGPAALVVDVLDVAGGAAVQLDFDAPV